MTIETFPLAETFPHAERLVTSSYPPGYERECLDADLRVNTRLADLYDAGLLDGTARELDRLLELCPDEESARRVLEPWMAGAVPRNESYLATLVSLQDLADQGRTAPACLVRLSDEDDRPRTFRVSRFLDVDTANAAATEVLRCHEPAVRGWHADHDGLWRQHYYADLGRPVGVVKDTRRGFSAEVTGAVVILRRDPVTDVVCVYEAYPELPLDEEVRRRYPLLPHLFGAYFGDVPERPWLATEDFFCWSPGAHPGMREQVRDLVTLEDDALRLAVEALGSHVLPRHIRAWLEMLHFRIERDVALDDDGQPIDRSSMLGR